MKIEVEGHIIEFNPIKYVDMLRLKGEFYDVYRDIENISQKEFNILLGNVSEVAFDNAETVIGEFKYETQLNILTKIMSEYLGLSDNQKKSDGV
mgnify:FL=1